MKTIKFSKKARSRYIKKYKKLNDFIKIGYYNKNLILTLKPCILNLKTMELNNII